MTAGPNKEIRPHRTLRRLWSIIAIVAVGSFALLILEKLATGRKSVNTLLAEMRSGDHEVASTAEQTLREAGSKAVPDLIKALDRKDPRYRNTYEAARRRLPAFLIRVVPEMHERALDRRNALTVLAKFGPAAKPALPGMIQLLGDENMVVKIAAVQALGSLGPNAEAAIPSFLQLVKTNELYLRVLAASSLWRIAGGTHEQIVREAALSVVGKEYSLTAEGIRLLKQSGNAELAVPVLVEALSPFNAKARRSEAAVFLGQLGPIAKTAVPELTAALFDEAAGVRACAAEALGNIGPDARSALPLLYEAASQYQPVPLAFDVAIAKIEGVPVPPHLAPRKRPVNRRRGENGQGGL